MRAPEQFFLKFLFSPPFITCDIVRSLEYIYDLVDLYQRVKFMQGSSHKLLHFVNLNWLSAVCSAEYVQLYLYGAVTKFWLVSGDKTLRFSFVLVNFCIFNWSLFLYIFGPSKRKDYEFLIQLQGGVAKKKEKRKKV